MIFLGLALLFVLFLAVTLLAAWYGAWIYKRGYREGYDSCKREMWEIDEIMEDAAEKMGVVIDLQRASHRRPTQ